MESASTLSRCHESSEPTIDALTAKYSPESMKQSAPTTHLLSLPKEVRVKILRELLYHRRALAREHNKQNWGVKVWSRNFESGKRLNKFSFSPQILRACHQLYDEGFRVLYYENCLQICRFSELWTADPPLPNQTCLPANLRKHMHTFEIHIEMDEEEFQKLPLYGGYARNYRFERMARFVRNIDRFFYLRHLTIDITTRGDMHGIDIEHYLKVFRVLRCERVRFILNGTEFRWWWMHMMESTERAVDIYSTAMKIIDCLPSTQLQGPRCAVRDALYRMDPAGLEEARNYAIAAAEQDYVAQRTQLTDTVLGSGGTWEGTDDETQDIDRVHMIW